MGYNLFQMACNLLGLFVVRSNRVHGVNKINKQFSGYILFASAERALHTVRQPRSDSSALLVLSSQSSGPL
jgi:hypothetical protein